MKKLVVLAFAVAAVAVAGPGSAKTVTLAVTKNGFVPKTESIATGDDVTFVNQDTVAHQLVLKPATGFTCTGGLVVQPAQSSTCTFTVAGSYALTDANQKGAAFKGTISVTGASITISLHVLPLAVTYGGKTTLSGSLASGTANEKLSVDAMECGTTAMKTIASVVTTTGGAYTYAAQPAKTTTYEMRFKSQSSAQVLVKVRPKVSLRKLARGKYSASVLAAESFAGKAVLFQRYVSSTGRWVTVKTVLLKAGPTLTLPINPTVKSLATFRSRIKARLKVRALLTQAQAGTCYLATRSNVILS